MALTALLSAFVAGLASFASPCVLPLVPIYLAQLVGPSIQQSALPDAAPALAAGAAHHSTPGATSRATSGAASGGAAGDAAASGHTRSRRPAWSAWSAWSDWPRPTMLLHAATFVLGFGVIFIAFGATASALGALLAGHQLALRRVGGVILVALGLHVAGILRVPGLERERRLAWRVGAPGYSASLTMGAIFAIGWTPCVGPYLASILVLAAQARTLSAGVALLAVYALGLGLPFLFAGLLADRLTPMLRRLSPYLGLIERVAGLLLMLLGIAIFFNWLYLASSWFPAGL